MKPILYTEIRPPSELEPFVETFWTLAGGRERKHRVCPDGCMDLVCHFRGGAFNSMILVGAMTCPAMVPIFPDDSFFGVRFQPGMLPSFADCDPASLCDRTIDLIGNRLWRRAAKLAHELPRSCSSAELRQIFTAMIPSPKHVTRVQSTLCRMVQSQGSLSLEQVIAHSNMSERSFRRECLLTAGITPKMLQRVLRFRRASKLLAQTGDICVSALESGFCDQAHMTREFRVLSGLTPAQLFWPKSSRRNS